MPINVDDYAIREAFTPFVQELLNIEVKKNDDNYRWCTICIFNNTVRLQPK